ncbi:hypothetical protein D3C71_1767970 [compost metagenome]
MQLGGFEMGGDFAEIRFQGGIDIAQIAQFVVKQLAFIAPVAALSQLLFRRAELSHHLFTIGQLFGFVLRVLIAGNQPANG